MYLRQALRRIALLGKTAAGTPTAVSLISTTLSQVAPENLISPLI